jgi:hypothetical protein
MPEPRGYGSPAAFRRALTDRLRSAARTGRWELAQLQRQLAYDRLLARLYLVDDSWVVKGATALLARDIGVRATIDIDLYRAGALETAEAELRAAAAKEVGDWFRFEVGSATPVAGGGRRLPVAAAVGATPLVSFHVDLVGAGTRMTGEPEWSPPLARVELAGVTQLGYRVYPLVDHVADKVTAMFDRYGSRSLPSTRYKDLVDLVAILRAASIPAGPQLTALRSEAERRAVVLPARFAVPDPERWRVGYAAEAGRSLLADTRTLPEASALVGAFLDPLVAGAARGRWAAGGWSG